MACLEQKRWVSHNKNYPVNRLLWADETCGEVSFTEQLCGGEQEPREDDHPQEEGGQLKHCLCFAIADEQMCEPNATGNEEKSCFTQLVNFAFGNFGPVFECQYREQKQQPAGD